MLLCWHGDPAKRPTFNSLQMDLDDFSAVVEQKYTYAAADFMQENQMTDTVQNRRGPRRKTGKEDRPRERKQIKRR